MEQNGKLINLAAFVVHDVWVFFFDHLMKIKVTLKPRLKTFSQDLMSEKVLPASSFWVEAMSGIKKNVIEKISKYMTFKTWIRRSTHTE